SMKVLKIGSFMFLMAIAGIGAAMAATNPSQDAYEDYAVEQLSDQISQRLCEEAPSILTDTCDSFLSDNEDWIRELVSDGTQRRNFVVLSLYTTDLSAGDAINKILPPAFSFSADNLPGYHFETVGVFRQFFTYEAERT
ncbi:MAG: DUF4359 domain-containing protein, partial [Leptolyngbyaceae bacterium]|nr:DUF4359 domain-containing protein [Leptolyngbyaceae bacterium]